MRRALRFCLLIAASLAFAAEGPVTPAIEVVGIDGTNLRLDREMLRHLPQSSVEADDHGTPGRWSGVPLIEILRNIGAPLGTALRGKNMDIYVLVSARDGYRAVYALAEFDPAFGNSRALLAHSRDGKALSQEEGPFRMVMPEEKRQARWVRQVERIQLLHAPVQ